MERITGVIQWGLDRTGDAYIAAASAAAVLGIAVGAAWMYGLACMLPQKASKRLGRFATINFPPSGVWAINWKLFGVAVVIALFGDVPLGWVGDVTAGTNDLLAGAYAPLPGLLLGGN